MALWGVQVNIQHPHHLPYKPTLGGRQASQLQVWQGSSWSHGVPAFQDLGVFLVEARKLEHSFRRISARIPYTLP